MALRFGTYITEQEMLEGLDNKTLFKGILKFIRSTFVNIVATFQHDAKMVFENYVDLNCGLDCDVVAARPKLENYGETTAMEVVYILKKVNTRTAVGILQPPLPNYEFTLFFDRRKIVGPIRIPKSFWPQNFDAHPELYKDTLILARITEWTDPAVIWGELLQILGSCGNIYAETLAIRSESYNEDYIPIDFSLKIQKKIDLRSFTRVESFVFSVMDSRSKAIEVAFSCEEIDEGKFTAGVHISNVSCYLEKNTSLNKYIFERVATMWLEGTVYHMLPEDLEALCSLYPTKDKPCISVFWDVSANGEISQQKYKQTIINSSAVLTAYEIENIANGAPADGIEIYKGYSGKYLVTVVKRMKMIAKLLKQKRTKHTLKDSTYNSTFFKHTRTQEPLYMMVVDGERMNEVFTEITFFANFLIGDLIFEKFPHLAILKVADQPFPECLDKLGKIFATAGLDVDVSSNYNLKMSLKVHADKYPRSFLDYMISKFCWKQRYICSNGFSKDALFHGNFGYPVYAHGTSPMGKYTDIIVQSLVESAITKSEAQWSTDEINNILEYCKIREFLVQEAKHKCASLFTNSYVSRQQPFIQDAIVCEVDAHYFMALIVDLGITVKIYSTQVPNIFSWNAEEIDKDMWKITVRLQNAQEMVLELFKAVKIQLSTKKVCGNFKLVCKLLPN